jgi:hypothetical protein
VKLKEGEEREFVLDKSEPDWKGVRRTTSEQKTNSKQRKRGSNPAKQNRTRSSV